MLKAPLLAERLRDAIGERSRADLARTLGTSPQAVSSWVKTGRIAKGWLPKLAIETGKPLLYFLEEDYMSSRAGEETTIRDLAAETGLTPEEIFAAVSVAASSKKTRRTAAKAAKKKVA